MPTWNADQYLRFADQRTRPCRDLAAAVALENPRRIVDLGCGPGNSTAVLAARWPEARVEGVDSSAEMIAAARKAVPEGTWTVDDIATWEAAGPVDLLFSNAALQWVPDHAGLYPRLFTRVAAGGAFAVQVPANLNAPAHEAMREVAGSAAWRSFFPQPVREWHASAREVYYDLLAKAAARIDLWETEYLHVLPGTEAIVDWYKGTGLRPFLDALPDEAARARFLSDYGEALRPLYPVRPDGRVLFPFQRLFLIAYR